jgi:hypothetical protein
MTAEVGQATQRKDRDKERSYSGSCDWRRRLEEKKFAGRHRKRTNGGAFPHGGGRPSDLGIGGLQRGASKVVVNFACGLPIRGLSSGCVPNPCYQFRSSRSERP